MMISFIGFLLLYQYIYTTRPKQQKTRNSNNNKQGKQYRWNRNKMVLHGITRTWTNAAMNEHAGRKALKSSQIQSSLHSVFQIQTFFSFRQENKTNFQKKTLPNNRTKNPISNPFHVVNFTFCFTVQFKWNANFFLGKLESVTLTLQTKHLLTMIARK